MAWRQTALFPAVATFIASVAAAATALTGPAAAAPQKRASFVVDVKTGRVLHANKARALRYPASLTKMMTLYLVFEHIENGQLSYGTKISVSPYASTRPPSRLGLKPGDVITVRQAVLALIVKSANDVATAVAEHLAGSEVNFARLMTRRARQLGMANTRFRNASGLPDANQVTTARDIAQLALRLKDHFPRHYAQFRTRQFRYKGRRYRSHNSLLGRYRGVDGIKTGYTRASGFNLVTSLSKNGRSIIAVVLGGKTARARNGRMRRLLNKYIERAATTRTRRPDTRIALKQRPRRVASRRRVARAPAKSAGPQLRRIILPQPPTRATAPSRPAHALVRRSQPKIEIARVRRVGILPAPRAQPRWQTSQVGKTRGRSPARWTPPARAPQSRSIQRGRPPGTLDAQASRLHTMQQRPPRFNRQAAPAQQFARSTLGGKLAKGGAQIQVGAYLTAAEAERQLQTVAAKAGPLLTGARPLAIRARSGHRQVYRARYAGFARKSATSACDTLRRLGINCFVALDE